jgi:hypothetical protein
MAATLFDINSWEYTQRLLRILHNRDLKTWFRDINSDTQTFTGRQQLKTAFLIRDDDSAIETLNKMLAYQVYIKKLDGISAIASVPEDWKLKPGASRPQLAVIFKPKFKKDGDGHYPIYIPHYDGSRTPKIKPYSKGNHWARVICKDNSQIVINGKTEAEAIKVIKDLIPMVEAKYRPKQTEIKTGSYVGKIYKEIEMQPIRADFYKLGKTQTYPTWQHYF